MKYNFIGEDEHTFTVRHPDGSEFSIAKQAVGPGVHKMIKGLPPIKMAEGGEVPEMDEDIEANKDQEMRPPSEINSLDSFKNMILGQDQPQSSNQVQGMPGPGSLPVQSATTPMAPEATPNIVTPTPQSPTNQTMPGNMTDAYANAFAQKESGITDVAKAQEQAGKQQAADYKEQVDQIAKAQAHYEQAHRDLDVEHQDLMKAVMNDKLDPNRLLHNMSTGNKVLAAISVALAGIGSGLTGKSNMAMDVIQQAIGRDIEAQKMDIGKKHTLLSENLRRYGDLNTATNATMLQINAITQAKVMQAAAQSGSTQAQAQAKVMLGDLGLQSAQIKRQMAIQKMAMEGGNYDPSIFVSELVPKEHQKSVFDEIQRAQDTRRMGDTILKSFDQAAKDNTVLRTGAGFLRTPATVLALHQSMQPTFKDLEGTVRQAAMDNTFKNITPSPGDADSTIKTKRAALEDYLKSKASASTAKGFKIDLDKFGTTTTTRQTPPVARQTPDGRVALFDPNTKQFIRYQ